MCARRTRRGWACKRTAAWSTSSYEPIGRSTSLAGMCFSPCSHAPIHQWRNGAAPALGPPSAAARLTAHLAVTLVVSCSSLTSSAAMKLTTGCALWGWGGVGGRAQGGSGSQSAPPRRGAQWARGSCARARPPPRPAARRITGARRPHPPLGAHRGGGGGRRGGLGLCVFGLESCVRGGEGAGTRQARRPACTPAPRQQQQVWWLGHCCCRRARPLPCRPRATGGRQQQLGLLPGWAA